MEETVWHFARDRANLGQMAKWTLYYNPKCSKCREALSRLQSLGVEPQIIEYLKTPPTEETLKELMSQLQEPISNLVRTKEEDYSRLNFDLNSQEEIARNLAKHPNLIERPIVVKDCRAVVARPVEKLELLLAD